MKNIDLGWGVHPAGVFFGGIFPCCGNGTDLRAGSRLEVERGNCQTRWNVRECRCDLLPGWLATLDAPFCGLAQICAYIFLNMEEHIRHSDVLHGITNDVFQVNNVVIFCISSNYVYTSKFPLFSFRLFKRIIELGPQLREFVTSAKQYHKALLGKCCTCYYFYRPCFAGFPNVFYLRLNVVCVYSRCVSRCEFFLPRFRQNCPPWIRYKGLE